MTRQLVSIRTVSAIEDIPKADFISVAHIDGWQVVVKRGEFAVGDRCVFFEVDSLLPADNPAFAFLAKDAKDYDGVQRIRLRTIKLRKVLSQGLALPLTAFPGVDRVAPDALDDFLGVTKWIPPGEREPNPAAYGKREGKRRGGFPAFVPKTDEPRIQNMAINPQVDVRDYEVTLKHDGCSITVYRKGGVVGVCSRNLELALYPVPPKTLWQKFKLWFKKKMGHYKADGAGPDSGKWVETANALGLVKAVMAHPQDIAVQGELVGPDCNGCRAGETERDIRVFNIFDVATGRYLNPEERRAHYDVLCLNGYTGKHAEVIASRCKLADFGPSLLDWANTIKINGRRAEGAVFKCYQDGTHFKVVSNDYLIEHGL